MYFVGNSIVRKLAFFDSKAHWEKTKDAHLSTLKRKGLFQIISAEAVSAKNGTKDVSLIDENGTQIQLKRCSLDRVASVKFAYLEQVVSALNGNSSEFDHMGWLKDARGQLEAKFGSQAYANLVQVLEKEQSQPELQEDPKVGKVKHFSRQDFKQRMSRDIKYGVEGSIDKSRSMADKSLFSCDETTAMIVESRHAFQAVGMREAMQMIKILKTELMVGDSLDVAK
jgi:hypothetical protein